MEFEKRIEVLEKKMSEISEKLDKLVNKGSLGEINQGAANLLKDESPREFFLRFNPKNDTQKTLVGIHFLEKKGLKSITVKEIAPALKEMRATMPKNISDKIQLLDIQGLLKPTGQVGRRKSWLVSDGGYKVLMGLQENAKRN